MTLPSPARPPRAALGERLCLQTRRLAKACDRLSFEVPVTHIYNPLEYAWLSHQEYLLRYANDCKRTLFVGMNPGPWGMAQTGVPFGEVAAVRGWLGIDAAVDKPACEHPARPVLGLQCPRSEVSGRRLWGFFESRYGNAAQFFSERLVLNYCPLLFIAVDGKRCRNLTPAALPADEAAQLSTPCDRFLRYAVRELSVTTLIGVGRFAEARLQALFGDGSCQIGVISHPSPANPAANGDYAALAGAQLDALGV